MSRENKCHWCNKQKNDSKKRSFNNCTRCIKIYCRDCINQFPCIKPKKGGCLFCLKLCKCTDMKSKLYCFKAQEDQKILLENQINIKKRAFEYDVDSTYIINSYNQSIKIPYKKRKILRNVTIHIF